MAGNRIIPGPDNTTGALTLQKAYNGAAAIITAGNGAVALSRILTDAISPLTIDKSPAASAAGSAIDITMGLQSTGPAINVDNLGSEAVINSTAAFAITVASSEAVRWNTNLDQQNEGSVFLKERAAEAADIGSYGQIWAKTDQSLWFTDSAGADRQLDSGSNLATLGTPTYSTMQHARDTAGSMGIISGGVISDDADGTITVSAGTGLIRAIDSHVSTLYNFDFAAEAGANVALTDNAMNFVYIEYNAGTPQIIAALSFPSDHHSNLMLGTVYRMGTDLHISNSGHEEISEGMHHAIQRFAETEPFQRAAGGIISETGTRNYALTAGTWWQGLTHFDTAAFDSSGADSFHYLYRDGAGGWTEVASSTQISNSQYDDASGTLASLTGSRYGVAWAYIAQDDEHHVIYGRGNYTLAGAEAVGVPTDLPPWFAENHARIVGKIILQNGSASFTTIESPFTTLFTGGAPTDHGDLIGLTDDDHAQYTLTDGTRLLTGPQAWDSGGASDPNIRASTVDPSAGGGVVAPEGSLLMRYVSAAGEIWYKDGAADTAWTQVGTGGGGGGGTLDAAYDFGGAGLGRAIIADSGAVTLTTDAVGTAETSAFELINSTVAAAGAQQFGPMHVDQGSGWKTDATAGPQIVKMSRQLQPIQGSNRPGLEYVTSMSIENLTAGAYFWHHKLAWAGTGTSYQLLGRDNAAATPTWSFDSEPGAGMYLDGVNPSFSASGVQRFRFGTNAMQHTYEGSTSSPGISRIGDTDTGYWWIDPDITGVSTGGTIAIQWNANQTTLFPDGAAGTAGAWSFAADTNTGCYRGGADDMRFQVGGNLAVRMYASGVSFGKEPHPAGLRSENFGNASNRWNKAFISDLDIEPQVNTSGVEVDINYAAVAHTGLTASTEVPSVLFDLSATKTWATGAIASQSAFKVFAPTLAFAGASTVTDAATMEINGVPEEGTNATITEATVLRLQRDNIGETARLQALTVANEKDAVLNTQEHSPAILWKGSQWDVDSSAARESMWSAYIAPLQTESDEANVSEWRLDSYSVDSGWDNVISAQNPGPEGSVVAFNAVATFDQNLASRALPVIALTQDDVSEEFIRMTGQAAAANLTQSLVDDGDVTTPTLVGWFKVNIQDEGNQVTDGSYFVPFYSLA